MKTIEINHVINLKKAFSTLKKRQKKMPLPEFEKRKRRLLESRIKCIGNESLLEKTIKKLEKNGIEVYYAKDKETALKIILDEVKGENLIVKSKSNVTKEIELADFLEKNGVKVIETDIGDRVMQIMGEKPAHPTCPIAHISVKEISKVLSTHFKKEIPEIPEKIVEIIREEVINYIKKAKVGITGANAITAEEGAVIIVHNEGNIYETFRKEKHIVVTAIDKVYPNIEEAINMIKILTYNATGAFVPSFIEILSGISKTADIEKKFFKGVHTPREMIVILLDNKRSEIAKSEFKKLLYCIECGNCLIHCPVYNTIGNSFGYGKYLGGKGLVYAFLQGEIDDEKLEFCLTCGRCKENCPLGINIPQIVRKIRSSNLLEEIKCILKSHFLWAYYNFLIYLNKQR